jgi:hypothetical protein
MAVQPVQMQSVNSNTVPVACRASLAVHMGPASTFQDSVTLTWRRGDGGEELETGPSGDDLRTVAEVQRPALEQGAQCCQHLRRRGVDALHQQPAAAGDRLQAHGRTLGRWTETLRCSAAGPACMRW